MFMRLPASLFIIPVRKVLFALRCFPIILVFEQFVFELFCMYSLCFHPIVLSFYCQLYALYISKSVNSFTL